MSQLGVLSSKPGDLRMRGVEARLQRGEAGRCAAGTAGRGLRLNERGRDGSEEMSSSMRTQQPGRRVGARQLHSIQRTTCSLAQTAHRPISARTGRAITSLSIVLTSMPTTCPTRRKVTVTVTSFSALEPMNSSGPPKCGQSPVTWLSTGDGSRLGHAEMREYSVVTA